MNPLPSVESVCSMLQQEELQRQVLEHVHTRLESSALLSKNVEVRNGEVKCSVCGNRGHPLMLAVVGYRNWHPMSKKHSQRKIAGYRQGRQQQKTQNYAVKTKGTGFRTAN